MKTILAIDPSLTSSGYATSTGVGLLEPPKDKNRGMPRVNWIVTQVLTMAHVAELVVIEDYSYGSQGKAILNIAELGGALRWILWRAEKPVVVIPPATLKKFATGKGNAGKDEVLAAAIRRLDYGGHSNDEADALWLYQAALHAYGLPGAVLLPASQVEAIRYIEWPGLPAPPPKPKGKKKARALATQP